jgi:trimethylamine--corrinoid protein Co-methyltransferase
MAQIVRPGAPVLFGGAPATFHMKSASSPMAAIEAQHLNVAYVAVAKSLGLPTQAYMALSDAKFLDAQAGGETFSSALLAALAGVNSVSGPGMLDFVLTFSLPKLVFDNEVCGQSLHFVREMAVIDDLPSRQLIEDLRANDHLITSAHTLKHWPHELYLTDQVIDRENRETWQKAGAKDLYQRACEEVETRLARYRPIETDARLDVEMRRLITEGLTAPAPLPELPPPPEPTEHSPLRARRPNRRRAV